MPSKADMPSKAGISTDVIPLEERSSTPLCMGQEPVRTSEPARSTLKVQPPKDLVQGTVINRGSAPFFTPFSGVPGFVIAATAIEPTLFARVADTLTAGDDCAEAGFVKLNVTTQNVPDMISPDATVSNSLPELCFHAPVVPRKLDVDMTAKLAESAVCVLVSPVIITVDPV